jgi:hypothetical protein
MKTKLILATLLPLLMCVGCRKDYECNELSWTGYNSVKDIKCHLSKVTKKDNLFLSHEGDTLRLYGWLFLNEYHNNPYAGVQRLTSNKEIIGEINGSIISGHCVTIIIEEDTIMPENPYDSMLYVKGVVHWSASARKLRIYVYDKITKTPEL